MEEQKDYPKEFSTKLIKSRDKLSLVIKYLDKLNTQQPSKEVNDDCVRMLMEVLSVQIEMYKDLNNLPQINTELQFQNNLLIGENKRLKKEVSIFESKLGKI